MNKTCIGSLLLLVCIFTLSCKRESTVWVSGTEGINAENVTHKQLMANQDYWLDKVIEVEGYFVYQFEDVAIYSSKKDFEEDNKSNALWLSLHKELAEKTNLNDFSHKVIKVKGYFSPAKGHLMQYGGTINEAFFIEMK